MDVVRDIINDRTDINYGSLYENVVAQELKAHGLTRIAPGAMRWERGVMYAESNVETGEKVDYLPIYAVSLLKRE